MRRRDGLFNTQRYSQARRFIHQDSPRPLITYGKKDTKLISLSADQFRTSVYDLPTDDDDNDAQQAARAVLQAVEQETKASQDSVLSDAALLQHLPVQRREHDEGPTADGASGHVLSRKKKQINHAVDSGKTASKQNLPPAKVAKPKSKVNGSTKNATKASKRKAVTPRGVPANELHLVPSNTVTVPRKAVASSYAGVAFEDPIVDSSLAPCKRAISPAEGNDEAPAKKLARTPVGVLKTRWKGPLSRFKSLRRGDKLPVSGMDLRGRDGFEKCEPRLDSGKKRRTRRLVRTPSVPNLAALDLTSGPLPDVDFHDSAVELDMGAKVADEGTPPSAQQQRDDGGYKQTEAGLQSSRRRTSSILRIRERIIMSELSSVRAPERIPSDSEEPEQEGIGDYQCADDVANHNEHGALRQNEHQDTRTITTPQQEPKSNQGVSLDFRRPGQIRQSTKSSKARRPVLMEVDETIMDVVSPVPQRNCHRSTNYHQPDLSIQVLEQAPVTGK